MSLSASRSAAAAIPAVTAAAVASCVSRIEAVNPLPSANARMSSASNSHARSVPSQPL